MTATRLSFLAVALVCAALGAVLAVNGRHEARLERASADLSAGRYAQALAELNGVGGDNGRATRLRGSAHSGRGQLRLALAEFREAARRDPNDWVMQRDYAIVLLRAGERGRARQRMRAALALNPRMPLPRGFALETGR